MQIEARYCLFERIALEVTPARCKVEKQRVTGSLQVLPVYFVAYRIHTSGDAQPANGEHFSWLAGEMGGGTELNCFCKLCHYTFNRGVRHPLVFVSISQACCT